MHGGGGGELGGARRAPLRSMSDAAQTRLLRPVPPMGLAKNEDTDLMAHEQLLAAKLRDALVTRFDTYVGLQNRMHADTEEWIGPWIERPGGARESISVGDNVAGDRLVWLRIDAAGVKEFVVYIRMGGEGEIVVQIITKCPPGQFEETISRAHPAGWENVDQLYGMALHWVTA